jgi:hypothetical protein
MNTIVVQVYSSTSIDRFSLSRSTVFIEFFSRFILQFLKIIFISLQHITERSTQAVAPTFATVPPFDYIFYPLFAQCHPVVFFLHTT